LKKPVLVIDDEETIRNLICTILESEGIESNKAADGEAGIKLFEEYGPEIVITDVRMPKVDGIQVLKRVKEIDPDTEVIVVTGHGEINLAIEALHLDASDFIQKPFAVNAFLVAMKRATDKIKMRGQLEQTQVQLLQSDKMASLGQLAAGVAHEINNPIGFVNSNLGTLKKYTDKIVGVLEELSRFIQKEGREELKNQFDSIKRKSKIDFIIDDINSIIDESMEGTNRVKQIVLDLKNYSRVDSKKLEDYNINQGIESTLNIIRNEIKYNCEVQKELQDLPLIRCYPQQINQVIMNLLINASQAIKESGIITIKTQPIDKGVKLEISDNGSGIPYDIIDKIFDPFFTTKEVGKGTGLGLATSYGIVEDHGGKIGVKSKVGEGTTFTIELPIHQGTQAILIS